MKHRNFIAVIAAFAVASTAFAQAATPTATASATATASVSSAAPATAVAQAMSVAKMGALSVSVGTATGVLTFQPISVEVGPAKKAAAVSSGSSSKARASASASANASAKAGVPENGRLVVMKCDNTFAVTPTQEAGTVVHEARNCVAPQQPQVPTGIRIIEAPAAQVVAVAAASAAATAVAQAPVQTAGPVASSESTWLWHPHDASDTAPKGCVVALGSGSGLPPRCSSFKVEPAKAGETKNAWRLRVGGGQKPTDTGFYNKQ